MIVNVSISYSIKLDGYVYYVEFRGIPEVCTSTQRRIVIMRVEVLLGEGYGCVE